MRLHLHKRPSPKPTPEAAEPAEPGERRNRLREIAPKVVAAASVPAAFAGIASPAIAATTPGEALPAPQPDGVVRLLEEMQGDQFVEKAPASASSSFTVAFEGEALPDYSADLFGSLNLGETAASESRADVKELATQVYKDLLGRAPTAEELKDAQELRTEDRSAGDIKQILENRIWKSEIRQVFKDELGRGPTDGELGKWLAKKPAPPPEDGALENVVDTVFGEQDPDEVKGPSLKKVLKELTSSLRQTPEWRERMIREEWREATGGRKIDPDSRDFKALVRTGRTLAAQGKSPAQVRAAVRAEVKERTTLVSVRDLERVMPSLSHEKAVKYAPLLNDAMREFHIDTPARAQAFVAQLAHESCQLRYFEEIASGAAYEGRADLGNTQPGDGVRYKGRGPIQLTGRSNYRTAGKALGLDLINHPKQAAQPKVGFRIAGWFWQTHGLNQLADQGDFIEITHRINGGENGLSDRLAYWRAAKAAHLGE